MSSTLELHALNLDLNGESAKNLLGRNKFFISWITFLVMIFISSFLRTNKTLVRINDIKQILKILADINLR